MMDKLDKFVCLKATDVVIPAGSDESSSDDSDDSGSDSEQSTSEDDEPSTPADVVASTKTMKKLKLDGKDTGRW